MTILAHRYGVQVMEKDAPDARPLSRGELGVIIKTIREMGAEWYGPFLHHPLRIFIDRKPGGGGFGNGWLRIGDPQGDLSVLYRILIHEGTHASNEYRGWMFENEWCFRPGFDWVKSGDSWTHPRQQGVKLQEVACETLPVDSRDVSTNPGEDLAEMVRYFVHSVKNERAFLWPLDQTKPPLYLWDTSPTRFVFVRDIFLRLPLSHPWYKQLSPRQEQIAAENLAAVSERST